MRKKFIKSSRPTYKKRIKKAQQGMKFVSYNPVSNPTIDYTDITNPINPFSEYNYNTTYDKPEALVVPVRDTDETDVVANNPTVEPVINKPVASKVTYTPKSYKGLAAFNKAYDEVEASNPEAKKYRQFLTKMAEQESGFNSAIQNRAGAPAYGYFQFMQDDKKYNNIRQYAGTDIETFRNNPKLQIEAAIKLAKSFENGFSKEDLELANKNGYSTWGLLGGAWLAGNGGVRKFLRGQGNPSDRHWSKEGKGTDVATRIKAFNFKEGGIIKYKEPAQPIKYMGGYDKRGNMVLPVNNENGMNNVTLPEVTVTPRNINLAGAVDRGRREAAPYVSTLLTGAIFGPLSVAGGYAGNEAVNKITNVASNDKYKDWADMLSKTTGMNPVVADFFNIGNLAGGFGMRNFGPKLNLTGDAYTTIGGKFGYYGNPVQRVWHTVGRNKNWKTSAKHPELMRKLEEPIKVNSNGTLQVTNPNPRFSETITNFTTDRPVVSHAGGNWDGRDLYIFNPKIVRGKKPASIEPSDTFYPKANITAKPSQTTLVSGNPLRLVDAKSKGMSTLSSPEARRLYQEAQWKYLGDLKKWKSNKDAGGNFKIKFDDYADDYAKEIQRLQSKRGTPTVYDYAKLERSTGLDAGVIGIDEMNPQIVDYYMNAGAEVPYPNGRVIDYDYFYPQINSEKNVLNRALYNKVFYDPTTTAEWDYKELHGIK